MGKYLSSAETKRQTNTKYVSDFGSYVTFTTSDSSWDFYRWEFGNNQVYSGGSIKVLFQDLHYFDDSVKVIANSDADTAITSLKYHLRDLASWPHYGKYIGNLWYVDHFINNVEIKVQLGLAEGRHGRSVQVIGLYKAACGCSDTLHFDNPGNDQLYREDVAEYSAPWVLYLENTAQCLFKNRYSHFSTGHYLSFKDDSLSLLSIHESIPGNSPDNRFLVTFKGKLQ